MKSTVKKLFATVKAISSFVWDKAVLYTFLHWVYRLKQPGVAFLVHPRDITDAYRQFPMFKYLSVGVTRWLGARFGAITLSRMRAPPIAGKNIRLELHSIVMDPVSMQSDRARLDRNLTEMAKLARRKNIRLIALGALLPSLTRYGELYTKLRAQDESLPYVTTGHMMTAWCIADTFRRIKQKRHGGKYVTVGVLGAAGSTGSLTCQFLRQLHDKQKVDFGLHLVDLNERRLKRVQSEQVGIDVTISTEIGSLQNCDYIVVVTNAQKVVLMPEHVSPGTVIIDDTQPRATSVDLSSKAYVVDVLAKVHGLNANFNFGFKTAQRDVTFSCLAEAVLLGVVEHKGHFAVGPGACKSKPGTMEKFLEYKKEAEKHGLYIESVLNISFAAEVSEDILSSMLERQADLQTAAE